MFDEPAIKRLVRGLPAIDAPPFNEGQDAVDAHLRRLLAELGDRCGLELAVEPREHGGTATFVEAFAWPSDGSTIRRLARSLAQTLREAPTDTIEGLTLLLSRLAPCAFIGSQTLQRVDDCIRFARPIGLATTEWIRKPPPAALAGPADRIRSDLACFGVGTPTPTQLLDPIPFQEPLDGVGSLMNIASPNRVFDALFRWCD